MKKRINLLTLLKCAVVLSVIAAIATSAYSAMVCTDAGFNSLSNERYRQVILCNMDAAPSIATDEIPNSAMARINRGYLYKLALVPGDTGPTTGSDLAITDADGITIISATGNGLNALTANTVTNNIHGESAGTWLFHPMGDGKAWTMTVTGNTQDNSSFQAIFHIIKDL
jgi:hypothetical protein